MGQIQTTLLGLFLDHFKNSCRVADDLDNYPSWSIIHLLEKQMSYFQGWMTTRRKFPSLQCLQGQSGELWECRAPQPFPLHHHLVVPGQETSVLVETFQFACLTAFCNPPCQRGSSLWPALFTLPLSHPAGGGPHTPSLCPSVGQTTIHDWRRWEGLTLTEPTLYLGLYSQSRLDCGPALEGYRTLTHRCSRGTIHNLFTFISNDLYNWKFQNPPFSERPSALNSSLRFNHVDSPAHLGWLPSSVQVHSMTKERGG